MFKFTEEEKAELLEMSEQLRQQMGDEYREEDASLEYLEGKELPGIAVIQNA